MQDQAESPSDQFAGMNLNQADAPIEEYMSETSSAVSVGSSVSQQGQTTVQVNAAMVTNAVEMINSLRDEVLKFY
jgi:hypothetical protein